jgi:hypothetical protein
MQNQQLQTIATRFESASTQTTLSSSAMLIMPSSKIQVGTGQRNQTCSRYQQPDTYSSTGAGQLPKLPLGQPRCVPNHELNGIEPHPH